MHTYAGPYPRNFPCSMTYFLYKCHVHFHIHFIMDNVYKYYEEIMCNYAYIEQDFVKHVFKPLYGWHYFIQLANTLSNILCFILNWFFLLFLDLGILHFAMQYDLCTNVNHAPFLHACKHHCDLQRHSCKDGARDGLPWEHTDGVTFKVQVKSMSNWVFYMVRLYERRSSSILEDDVYFKLAINARYHWNRGGHVILIDSLWVFVWIFFGVCNLSRI